MSRLGKVAIHAVAMLAAGLIAAGPGCGPPPGDEEVPLETQAVTAPRCRSPGASCDDGNPCTLGDTCSHQKICVGTPYSCSDGNACTDDACDGRGGCTFANNIAPCQDGNLCTFGDTCGGSVCHAGTTHACDDGNICTDDACNGAGGCSFTPNAASCNDGNACTLNDRCNGGACSGVTYGCDDGDACTDDACDGAGGCRHTLVASCGSCTGASCPSGLGAPTLTGARPISSYVEITWTDNATNEDGFRVERSRDLGATWAELRMLGPNATYTQDYAVAIEQGACYRVFAFDAQGDSPPSETRCTARPAAPSNLTAAAVGGGIELTWIDGSGVEDGYDVERTDGVVAYGIVAHLPADATSYRDAVTADVTFHYKVRATRDGGGSGYSNFVSGAVATFAPTAPARAQAIPQRSTAIGIIWSDDSANEAGFRVERSTDGGASWATVGALWFAAYGTDQFVDAGRIPDARVCYRAIAYNAAGESPPSPVACATPPAAPTDVTAASVPGGVLLTWTDNSAVEDGYFVDVVTGCLDDAYFGLPPDSTSYLDTGDWLCVPHALGYGVAAMKDGGWSDFITIGPPATITAQADR